MTKELEERLAALESELAAAKSSQKKPKRIQSKKSIILLVIGAFLVICAVSGWYIYDRDTLDIPLKSTTLKSVQYDVYYPRTLPVSYKFLSSTESINDNILFYKLGSGNKEILIIQQRKPALDTGLQTAVGLEKVSTPNGTAYVGKNKATPIAIVVADKTLINVTGTPDVPADVINGLVKSLIKVN